MQKKHYFNFLSLIATFFILSSCNTSNGNEPKLDEYSITWSDLNLKANLKTKYFDDKIHYILYIHDINGKPLSETNYYGKFIDGTLVLNFLDKDNFVLDYLIFEVSTATNILDSQNRVDSKQFKGSEIFSEDKYNKYTQIEFLTQDIN
tara:strand:+ start:652 stop:1095 length:444 start_codon:yes stop_codon:yes gene_type:complete